MKVVFTSKAAESINDVAAFVESKNTPGSGRRYASKFIEAIEQMAQSRIQYALCNHPEFALLGYSCRNYNDWIIAFKIEGNVFTVYEIVHGSILT